MRELREQIAAYCRENHIFRVLRIAIRDEIQYEQTMGFANGED